MACRIVLDGRCLCVGQCCCLPRRSLKEEAEDRAIPKSKCGNDISVVEADGKGGASEQEAAAFTSHFAVDYCQFIDCCLHLRRMATCCTMADEQDAPTGGASVGSRARPDEAGRGVAALSESQWDKLNMYSCAAGACAMESADSCLLSGLAFRLPLVCCGTPWMDADEVKAVCPNFGLPSALQGVWEKLARRLETGPRRRVDAQ